MTVIGIPLDHLHLAWPDLWPLLEPAVKRSPDFSQAKPGERPDVLARLIAGDAQLWAIVDPSDDLRTGGGRPVAGVVTQIKDTHPSASLRAGERRCLIWLVGGSRVREWAAAFIAHIEPWARALGCVALWGCGRTGWARIAPRLGGVRIEDHEGLPAWERRIA